MKRIDASRPGNLLFTQSPTDPAAFANSGKNPRSDRTGKVKIPPTHKSRRKEEEGCLNEDLIFIASTIQKEPSNKDKPGVEQHG